MVAAVLFRSLASTSAAEEAAPCNFASYAMIQQSGAGGPCRGVGGAFPGGSDAPPPSKGF
jgi:hypothetical protein